MKKLYSAIMMLALLFLPLQMKAEGVAIRVEYGSTSMTIKLNEQPKIINENGVLMLNTSSISVALTLPCKVTPIGGSNTAVEKVVIRNNEDNTPINVFTLDGKKIATLKDKKEAISLERGIYVINGKKILIK